MSGHHVTLERLFGQGHMTEMVDQNYFKIYINDTEVISVSRLWYSGSRNPNKVQLLMSGHHVTLERLFGQGHMT